VACILEERPLAIGGLADRVLAEVALKPGYAFMGTKPGPLDLGREIGRDPRLETWSWMPHRDPEKPDDPVEDRTSSLVVATEGPIGLHFERASTPAPAWPNCQYLLQPASLDGQVTVPDESFVGIRLRRVLDPAWVVRTNTVHGNPPVVERLPRQAARWIEWSLDGLNAREQLLRLENAGGKPRGICVFERQKGWATLSIDRHLVDPQGGSGHLVLCRIPLGGQTEGETQRTGTGLPWHFEKIVLLHSGAGDGRHVLSVLGIPSEDAASGSGGVAAGRSNAPIVLASVSWSIPDELKQAELCVGGSPCVVKPLLSSEPTFLEWARTARDAGTLHAVVDRVSGDSGSGASGSPARGINEWTRPFAVARSTEPIPVRSLKAEPDASRFSFRTSSPDKRWIVPPLAVSLQPLGIQRHLVGLFTRPTEEPGRRFERYVGAGRLVGPTFSLPQGGATAVRIAEIEVPSVVVGPKPVLMKLPSGSSDATCLRFHVRFANSPASLTGAGGVTVKLEWKKNGSDAAEDVGEDVVFEAEKPLGGVRALDAVYQNDQWYWRWQKAPMSSGNPASVHEVKDIKKPVQKKLPSTARAIAISVQATGIDVVWADVSLLSSRLQADSRDFDAFDYDWLFTPERPDYDADPSARISAEALSGLTDAQARIVSISPPIPIRASEARTS
jgi:hypothetical protein